MTTTDPPPVPAVPPAAVPRKRGRWFWVLQVVPPLLLPLLMLTSSGPGFYFGLAALIFFIGLPCLLSIVLRLVFLLFRRGDWRRLLRPALAIGVFVAAMVYLDSARHEAQVIAEAEAERIQAECVQAGQCPDALTVFAGEGPRRDIATSTHLSWPLRYRLTDDGFELAMDEMMDSSQYWTGGPNATLEHVHLVDGEAFDD